MKRKSCESCKYLIEDKPGSWMDKNGLFHYIPSRYYCTMMPSWLDYFYKKTCCDYYEPRGKKERIG